jgi:hypothetical protein
LRHAKAVFAALFSAAWATVQIFCRKHRQLKGEAGAIAVLHAHSRRLDLHPHVHLVMPGASLDARTRRWAHQDRPSLQPQGAGQGVSRQAVRRLEARKAELASKTAAKWVVDCKSMGNCDKAPVYLRRYLYRGVIREADILACDQSGSGLISFRYRDSHRGQTKVRTLPGAEFLHLLLQHVLPNGLRRARNYGFLHPNKKGLIALLNLVLRIAPRPPMPDKARPPILFPCCGSPMQILRRHIAPAAVQRREPVPAAVEMAF